MVYYIIIFELLINVISVWDLRAMTRGTVAQVTKLPNYFAQTDCIFSPDEKYIVTGKNFFGFIFVLTFINSVTLGTSIKKDEGSGLLIFFDKHTLRPVTHFGNFFHYCSFIFSLLP